MGNRRNNRDWGCMQWLILGILILATLFVLLAMALSPSGGQA